MRDDTFDFFDTTFLRLHICCCCLLLRRNFYCLCFVFVVFFCVVGWLIDWEIKSGTYESRECQTRGQSGQQRIFCVVDDVQAFDEADGGVILCSCYVVQYYRFHLFSCLTMWVRFSGVLWLPFVSFSLSERRTRISWSKLFLFVVWVCNRLLCVCVSICQRVFLIWCVVFLLVWCCYDLLIFFILLSLFVRILTLSVSFFALLCFSFSFYCFVNGCIWWLCIEWV